MVHRLRETRAGAAGVPGTDRERHELLWQEVLHLCRTKKNENIHSCSNYISLYNKCYKKGYDISDGAEHLGL